MEWQHLIYFRAIARREHMGRAAEELGVSQPALSRSIARLESQFGVALFDRVGRRVRLNRYGRILLARVDRALTELDNAEREIREFTGRGRKQVTLGFLATFAVRLIPSLIATFQEGKSEATFQLLQGPAPSLRQQLLDGVVDLCISSPRFADAEIEWQPLCDEELVVLVPFGHHLAGRKRINLIEIARENVVALKPGYGLRQIQDDVVRQAGFTPAIAFEGDEVATLVGLVGANFGVALVPKSVQRNVQTTAAIPIRTPRCFRTVGLSWLKGRYLSPMVSAFRDHVINTLHDQ